MGDGFAINPTKGTLASPVDGEVISIFPTKHAICLMDVIGREILIHVGIETVDLNGEGFTVFAVNGHTVKKGEKLLEVDLEFIKSKAPSAITSVIFTNLAENERVIIDGNSVKIQQDII